MRIVFDVLVSLNGKDTVFTLQTGITHHAWTFIDGFWYRNIYLCEDLGRSYHIPVNELKTLGLDIKPFLITDSNEFALVLDIMKTTNYALLTPDFSNNLSNVRFIKKESFKDTYYNPDVYNLFSELKNSKQSITYSSLYNNNPKIAKFWSTFYEGSRRSYINATLPILDSANFFVIDPDRENSSVLKKMRGIFSSNNENINSLVQLLEVYLEKLVVNSINNPESIFPFQLNDDKLIFFDKFSDKQLLYDMNNEFITKEYISKGQKLPKLFIELKKK